MSRLGFCSALIWLASVIWGFAGETYDLRSILRPPKFQAGAAWKVTTRDELSKRASLDSDGSAAPSETEEPQNVIAHTVYTQKIQGADESGQIVKALRFYRISETQFSETVKIEDEYAGKYAVYQLNGDQWDITTFLVNDGRREQIQLDPLSIEALALVPPNHAAGDYHLTLGTLIDSPVKIGETWDVNNIESILKMMDHDFPANSDFHDGLSHINATLVSVTGEFVQIRYSGVLTMMGQDQKGIVETDSRIELGSLLCTFRREAFFEVERESEGVLDTQSQSLDGKFKSSGGATFSTTKKVSFLK